MCRTSTPTTTCPTTSWKSSGEPLTGIQIRPLGPGDDIDAELDLRRRAFGPVGAAHLAAWHASVRHSIDQGAILGAFDDGRLIGSARYHVMRQWWHGRAMPMAGVAGVKVAPEHRGRGVGTAMMAALLADVADRGYPVSALYPATVPLYRTFGWEIAGGTYQAVVPSRSLAALIPADAAGITERGGSGGGTGGGSGERGWPGGAAGLRRATADDGPAIVAVKGRVHEALRHCGPNTREPQELRDWLDKPDHFCYLAADGFLSYRWAKGTEEVAVDELLAASAATARALWQILASHASMAGQVRACLPPDDTVQWLTRESDVQLRRTNAWMLRIVDAPAAIAARGFPAGVTLSVLVEIADPVRPANSGRWRLEVAGGGGSLRRADTEATVVDPVRLGARGLAALFAGAPAGALRLAGLLAGGDCGTDDGLDAAFGAAAFLLDTW